MENFYKQIFVIKFFKLLSIQNKQYYNFAKKKKKQWVIVKNFWILTKSIFNNLKIICEWKVKMNFFMGI